MPGPSVVELISQINYAVETIEVGVRNGTVRISDIADLKGTIDDARLRLWRLMNQPVDEDSVSFEERFRLRRARDLCGRLFADLRPGASCLAIPSSPSCGRSAGPSPTPSRSPEAPGPDPVGAHPGAPVSVIMDVIIVGAGVAGLAALERLSAAGVRPLVLEARDRVGGRVLTRHDAAGVPIDLGPEWLDGSGLVRHLLDDRGIPLVESEGRLWVRSREGLSEAREPYDRKLIRELKGIGGPDRTLSRALRRCCGDPRRSVEVQRLARYVEGFHAADPARVGLRWFLETEARQSAMDSSYRSPTGTDSVVHALYPPGAEIAFGAAVRRIRWRPGQARVSASTPEGMRSWEADKVLLTVPASLLALPGGKQRIRFDPEVPGKGSALERILTGSVHKLVLVFDRPFWEEVEPFGDLLMVFAVDQVFPTWWTMRPARTPILAGWVGGPDAARLDRVAPEARLDQALDSLAAGLGFPRRDIEARLTAWHTHDWQDDPWSRGAYTYVGPGGIEAWKRLARPVDRTLFFAGEATAAHGFNATVEGAVATGRRAAREILGEAAY